MKSDVRKKRVGVLMGGLSAEREISMRSGEAVAQALEGRGYDVERVLVDENLDRTLREKAIDVAFLAVHGAYGEDGCLQGFLEILGIPYTGSSVTACASAMDKHVAKQLFRIHNLPTPPSYKLDAEAATSASETHGSFGFPVYVKPRRSGSSLGGGRAQNLEELDTQIADAFAYDDHILVEQFIEGREITVGVLNGKALGALEICTASGVYDYEAKYDSKETRYLPLRGLEEQRVSEQTLASLLRIAESAHACLGASGATRVDFILSPERNEYLLEVNMIPGLLPTSLLPRIAAQAGIDYGSLCEAMLESAQCHGASRQPRPSNAASAAKAEPTLNTGRKPLPSPQLGGENGRKKTSSYRQDAVMLAAGK